VALTIEAAEREWPVTADRRRLRQALINLALNAIEACASGGAGRNVVLRVGAGATPDETLVEIVDDGPGMTARQQARAIEPFYTTKPNGTGLGLAIARRIVLRHRGGFAIASRAGAGTTVAIRLPRNGSDVSGVHRLRAERREEARCAS
jgi:signal transduction histidine kinase